MPLTIKFNIHPKIKDGHVQFLVLFNNNHTLCYYDQVHDKRIPFISI